MKSILICPDERSEVPLLAGETPLAMAPPETLGAFRPLTVDSVHDGLAAAA